MNTVGETSTSDDGSRPTAENLRKWRSAAADGHVEAMYNLGLARYHDGQYSGSDSAERWWRSGAKHGDLDCMLNLGLLRREQERLLGDDSADYWWIMAARAGSGDAMCNLGMHRHEQGQLDGNDSARSWWTQGSSVDHTDSAHNLEMLPSASVPGQAKGSMTPGPVGVGHVNSRRTSISRY